MVAQPIRTVTSPSIRSASSNSVRLTVWPLSAFSTPIALNFATCASGCCCRFVARGRAGRKPSGGRYVGPGDGLLDDRQLDQGRGDAEEDRAPPDDPR